MTTGADVRAPAGGIELFDPAGGIELFDPAGGIDETERAPALGVGARDDCRGGGEIAAGCEPCEGGGLDECAAEG